MRAISEQKREDLEFSPAEGQLHALCGIRGMQSLARKAHEEGYNALLKIKVYEPAGTPNDRVAHCFVTGIPAVITSEGKDPILVPTKPVHQDSKQKPRPQPKGQPPDGKQNQPKGEQQQQQKHQQKTRPKEASPEYRGPYLEDFYH
ncbi:hypothetical protein P389DRAFT_32637 [Cystobasidium minutum MCA 4210]|uniref:uncharacterized protein n=1 Tax=Cystobasidium minutum MCA 4210 TaxID=1397322 RepID=UPI0034CE9E1B|eukprot:jgi/Rhomi1/32637/CE32636_134